NFNLDLPQDSFFYFVHSYFPVPDDPEIIAGITDYEEPFCSAIQRGNLAAAQFHPEKSQKMGLGLLKNFVDLCQKKG
ncbi:MAG: imidazole glycerol phosphate synthase subunit HisH, partial [Candidatus Omnitrophica bacterium]|nr:imidazole glycerol phosphate synthase subunit HisH [Candidatus Omnitrophota bacterium]